MKTLILILLLTVFLILGCSTSKEAIQKGYLFFDKKAAIVGGVITLTTGSLSGDMGWQWNLPLMRENYPECFQRDDKGNYLSGWSSFLMCVQDKVKEEGFWR